VIFFSFSVCEDISSAREDITKTNIKISQKKYLLCEIEVYIKKEICLLQKIDLLLQMNLFFCGRRNAAVTTSFAAEDLFFG
jgi:hypothetical protein